MSHISRHRKINRASVLISRAHCLRNYPNNAKCMRSYKPLCEKLKNNNSLLAKALSKEKEENRLLFSQNVSLIAEVQDLRLTCNKNDIVISNILQNAKETLKMLVTITGYVTNTISTCQELKVSSGQNLQFGSTKRESYRRSSTKSPAKGVVKPMVSGHTITKPTINLSRINMQLINNPTNLNIIHEVASPIRSSEQNNARSPIAIRKRRYDNGPTRRMPERLTISATRVNEENERELSKRRSRHSGRMSGKHTRHSSSRLSTGCNKRISMEHIEQIGSPRVELNDVSRFLQNTQTINIRKLTENQSYCVNETSENNDMLDESTIPVMIPESPTENSGEDAKTAQHMEEESDDEYFDTEELLISQNKKIQRTVSKGEDPLEGPSWLFNNSQNVPLMSNDEKTDDPNTFNDNSLYKSSSKAATLNIMVNNTKQMDASSHTDSTDNSITDELMNHENVTENRKPEDDGFNNTFKPSGFVDSNENSEEEKNDMPKSFSYFVTQRRGCYDESEDEDDFTLMYHANPPNMKYDMNDLKMPVIGEFDKIPSIADDSEPEISVALKKITQILPNMPITNNRMHESLLEETIEQLPSISNIDNYVEEVPLKTRLTSTVEQKSTMSTTLKYSDDETVDVPTVNNNNRKHKKRKLNANNKDPSTVKVVLHKLNESDVRPKSKSSTEVINLQDSKSCITPSPIYSSQKEDSSDSECSHTSGGRTRRRAAVKSLKEPSLRIKMRR